jgi:hypothetical protein
MNQACGYLQPEIFLICDSAKLARTIEMIVECDGHVRTLLMDQFVLRPDCENCGDLIIIAFSKLADNPLDQLRRDCLIQWQGCQKPVLYIAPHPFACPPGEQIWYLEFPFEAQTLGDRVSEIVGRRWISEHAVGDPWPHPDEFELSVMLERQGDASIS